MLTWNLFHGRAVPGAGRDLRREFTTLIAGWEWDVALLQEVPPWWPGPLARACEAEARSALTARNALLPVRRCLATRWPDVIKSNGGGCNAILVRGAAIEDHRHVVLRKRPERRVAHAVLLPDGWVANLHAQVHSEELAQADLARAAAALDGWAGASAPVVLGGDTNTRHPRAANLGLLAISDVDAVLARGWSLGAAAEVLERGALSDHAPLRVTLREGSG